MFRILRIAVLLLILATVAQEAWLARSRAVSWKEGILVALYPIDGDGSDAAAGHVRRLQASSFKGIERFMDEEAKRHGLDLMRPVEIVLAPPLDSRPPQPPVRPNALESILWSLQMRWWTWRNDGIDGPRPNVRIFLLYHDPDRSPRLPHSVGLARGLIGLANVFATNAMAAQNNVVIAHEMLHALGATDKYDLATNLPSFPDGYADPARSPRHPQDYAEIMAGRVPVSETEAEIPENLEQALIGAATAAEINWSGR
ncbi:MAG: hypothetical protein OHM77_01670 [Candidatus Nitricoxidivorans perseverans]|uniref:Uncharacterized protein n=1 Tax=Candidatus Nitricoxidivorans perseverans TaxID=2975601 RepID=A0AA49FL59_9PROT|nr:MAG: hypothetical protein OHM77_01670 [Candidatus Nitricoxidivorans perseverans]